MVFDERGGKGLFAIIVTVWRKSNLKHRDMRLTVRLAQPEDQSAELAHLLIKKQSLLRSCVSFCE